MPEIEGFKKTSCDAKDCSSAYSYEKLKILHFICRSLWRHQIETFSALLALSVGNLPVTGEFPIQRQVTQSFDVFFDLRLEDTVE